MIEQHDRMGTGRDVESDLVKMYAHGLAVAAGHDDASGLALGVADRAEYPCRGTVLVFRC